MMDDLIAWLHLQIDEDQRRGLAECAAKRRILDEIVDEANSLDSLVELDRGIGERDTTKEPYVGDVLVAVMAQPYAGRPGWREEWGHAARPAGS